MSVFSVRCLSPHKRTSLVSISCCELSQCKTTQHSNRNLSSRKYLKKSSFSTTCPCGSHCCVRSANDFRVLAAGQRVGLKTQLLRPRQSLNLVLQQAHINTWLKATLETLSYRLGKFSPKPPKRLGTKLRQLFGRGSRKEDPSEISQRGEASDQLIPPVTEPTCETRVTDRKVAERISEPHDACEQHTLEKAVLDTNISILSYYQELTARKHLAVRDTIRPEDCQEKKTTQLSTPGDEQDIWDIYAKYHLPVSETAPPPKEQTVTLSETAPPPKEQTVTKALPAEEPTSESGSVFERLKKVFFSAAKRPGLRTSPALGQDSSKEGQSELPRSVQAPQMTFPTTEPAPEKQVTKRKDVKTMLEPQDACEQHTLENAVFETNESILSYYQDHLGASDKIQPEDSPERRTVPLTSSVEDQSGWNIFGKLPLSFPETVSASKEQTGTKTSPAEETSSETQLAESKDSEQKTPTKRESSTEEKITVKQHPPEEVAGDSSQYSLPYDHVLKTPEIEPIVMPQAFVEKEQKGLGTLRNVLHMLWAKFRLSSKETSRQAMPVAKTESIDEQNQSKTDAMQEPDFVEKQKQPDREKSKDQSIPLYQLTATSRRPSARDKIKAATSPAEDEAGWNVFRKFPIPFIDALSQKGMLRQSDFVSRLAVETQTHMLVGALKSASTHESQVDRVKELSDHIKEFPSSRHDATVLKTVPALLQMMQAGNQEMKEETLEALALLGYTAPVRGRGIRILCLDGGGTRALVSILCLKEMEKLSNRKIYELFDYVCGVSTGALLAAMLFLYQIPLDECERLYLDFSRKMFSRSRVIGAGGLVWNYAFYNSDQWEDILQKEIGHKTMIEFARNPGVPKVSAVSTLLNTPRMTSYVFRTYNFPPSVYSSYPGGCTHKLWEMIRASSAAPGYYEDFTLGNYVHSDGGLLANNPTALAIHESRLLWPGESVQCVVSLGTGRCEPTVDLNACLKVSLKEKLSKMVDVATDTESLHIMLEDVMPPGTYFRLNPYLSENLPLDEIRQDRLRSMKRDTKMYIRKNGNKIRKATAILNQGRLPHQLTMDWVKLKSDTIW